MVGLAENGLAELHLEWNDLDQARQWNEKSLAHFKLWGHAEHTLLALLTEAEIVRCAHDLENAFTLVEEGRALAIKNRLASSLKRVDSASARIYWEKGQTDLACQALCAAGFLEKTGQPEHPFRPTPTLHPMLAYLYPTGVWLLNARGETQMALEWLDR